MSKEKLILDIRYYESEVENISGNPLPSETGRLFSLPDEVNPFGTRVARKLREYSFITGDFDHLYINFTTALSEGEISISSRQVEKWFKYVDVGLDSERLNALDEVDKISLVEQATFRVLELISKDEQKSILERLRAEIANLGSEIEILHKHKETQSYEITLTYQVKPKGNSHSLAIIRYLNKKTGEDFQSSIELELYQDLFFLASSITYSKGYIVLKPRASYRAQVYNERYDVPVSIPVQ